MIASASSHRARRAARLVVVSSLATLWSIACSDGTPVNPAAGGSGGSGLGGAGGLGGGGGSMSSAGSTSPAAGTTSMAGTGAAPTGGSGGAGGTDGGGAGAGGVGGTGGAAGGGAGGGGAGGAAGAAGAAGNGGSGGSSGSGGQACTVPTNGGEDLEGVLTGPQMIEGEAATLSGAAAVAMEGSGWSGTGFADMKGSEGGMTWLIDVPAAGKYTLDWVYTQAATRDMQLTVNCMLVAESVPFANTTSWNTLWTTGGAQVVTLLKGTNQIVLETNGGSGPNFDAMRVSPPTCQLDDAVTVCEAEAALMTGMAGLASQGSGWLGEGFADMFGSEGAVHWVLDAPADGTYTLTFRYTQDDSRDMTLTVNGVVAAASLAFSDTNSWNTGWVADVSHEVTLQAGLNSVELATNGMSGPNFDSMSVTSPGAGGSGGAGGGGGEGGGG